MTATDWLVLLDGITVRLTGHRRQICKVLSVLSTAAISALMLAEILPEKVGAGLVAITVTLFTGLDQAFTLIPPSPSIKE